MSILASHRIVCRGCVANVPLLRAIERPERATAALPFPDWIAVGVLIIALNLPRGKRSGEHYGSWDKLVV